MVLALILAGALGTDWLLDPSAYVSKASVSSEEVTLDNGLVRRTIRLTPSPATVSFQNLVTGEELLRGVSPEARVTVGGIEYKVGGLEGQPIYNYLRTDWLKGMRPPKDAYKYAGSSEGAIEARFPCRLRREWMGRELPWPPKGRHVKMHYLPPKQNLPEVDVHYEIYDGLPLVCKWLTIENRTSARIELDDFTVDEIRYAESGQLFDTEDGYLLRNFHVLSDMKLQSTGSGKPAVVGSVLCQEPDYKTQMCYSSVDPWTLKVKPPSPPHLRIEPGRSVTSHRGWFLAFDSTERERRGLSVRRAYRTLAPWTDENPLIFHLTKGASPAAVREGIRQCAETGFETLIMSFGSGFNLESTNPDYRRQYRELSKEAQAKGIALGGYSLTASRDAGNRADNVHNPKPRFGRGPCLGAKWGMNYLANLKSFMQEAEFGIFENDGPYPGDTCSATNHPGHHGLADSLWVQWQAQSDLYKFCRAHGIYVNQPDAYFLNGGNKTGMGYKEVNWSLPREYQPVIERQNIFDGSWTKSTSMGWMFVPLAQYHGGGAAATVEPLAEHLAHYDLRFADTLGAGVQACWRGPRLFDTEKTLATVRKWVKFFKDHRRVLTGDLIHLRRPDGRNWDGWVKVDPQADEKAMAFLFNPTTAPIRREIRLPLYYSGLKDRARLSVNGANPVEVALDCECRATVAVEIPAAGYVWILAKKADGADIDRKNVGERKVVGDKIALARQITEARVWTSANGETLPYRLHLPKNPEAGRKYPLVIHMHGAGSRGADNAKQLITGGSDFLSWMTRNGEECVFLAPQCPSDKRWVDVDWNTREHRMRETPTAFLRMAMEIAADALARYPVDPDRVYVQGVSMGGYATWELLQRHPDWFAAALPCCGGGDVTLAARMRDVAIWVFHGETDSVVPVFRARSMVEALKRVGGNVAYREYPKTGHDSWTPTFSDDAVFAWLWRQRRAKR